MADARPRVWRDLIPLAPAVLLFVVAVAQLRLTRTEHLTPWKGGGLRDVLDERRWGESSDGIRVSGLDGDREITIPASLSGLAYRASLLPSTRRLTRLGHEIAVLESRGGTPVSRVRLAVWRMSYDPRTLAARPVLVRDLIVDIAEPRP